MKCKYFAAVLISAFAVVSFSGCSFPRSFDETESGTAAGEGTAEAKEKTQENMQQEENEKVKIGVSFDSMEQERREIERTVLEDTVQKLGALVEIQSAEGDIETQKEQIRQFTDESVNVIIVAAVDSSALEAEIRDARNQGILVVSYERLIQGEQTDLFVAADSRMAGEQIADEIKNQLPKGGSILLVCGPENDRSSQNTADTLEEELEGNSWEIVYRGCAASWSGEDEKHAVEEAFQNAGKQADAIVCATDRMAGMAAEILENEQRTGEMAVIGQNADSDACRRIQEGTQAMTIYIPAEELAEKAAEYAVQMAEGGNFSETITEEYELVGEEEEFMVPCYRAETLAVTEENLSKLGRNTF